MLKAMWIHLKYIVVWKHVGVDPKQCLWCEIVLYKMTKGWISYCCWISWIMDWICWFGCVFIFIAAAHLFYICIAYTIDGWKSEQTNQNTTFGDGYEMRVIVQSRQLSMKDHMHPSQPHTQPSEMDRTCSSNSYWSYVDGQARAMKMLTCVRAL